MTSCVPPRLTARNLPSLLTATPWASAAALPRGSSERVAYDSSEASRSTRVSRWPSTQPRSMLLAVVANPRFFMLAM